MVLVWLWCLYCLVVILWNYFVEVVLVVVEKGNLVLMNCLFGVFVKFFDYSC